MKQISFEAIGTVWWIDIFDEITDETLAMVKDRCERFCAQFNERYSRFLPDSLITQLNRERVLTMPDEECRALLLYGKTLYLRSQGAFNYLTGHILEARGYDATYSFKVSPHLSALPVCNPVLDIEITEELIRLHCGNVDIGGYGKGWLIDALVTELTQCELRYFLVNGGGDMYATSDHNEPITIYLEHPTQPNTYLISTTLQNEGFAASSPFKRQWTDGGETYTHIVSEIPTPQLAVFVKAHSATDADAFTKSALLLREEQLLKLCIEEKISCARFDPSTSELWQSGGFSAS
ncbi:MAG TPA: FAD:protein FMN transferase [Candidatus Paceibacterota bacterium]